MYSSPSRNRAVHESQDLPITTQSLPNSQPSVPGPTDTHRQTRTEQSRTGQTNKQTENRPKTEQNTQQDRADTHIKPRPQTSEPSAGAGARAQPHSPPHAGSSATDGATHGRVDLEGVEFVSRDLGPILFPVPPAVACPCRQPRPLVGLPRTVCGGAGGVPSHEPRRRPRVGEGLL